MSILLKTYVKRLLLLSLAGIVVYIAGCGNDNNNPPPTTTTTGLITADTTTGTVAAGTAVAVPAGVTSLTFASSSILTDSSGAPVTGAITSTVTRSTSATSLPAAAPTGTSLAVLLDIDLSKGVTKVKNFSTPMTVIVAVPAGITSVDVYSFNGTIWVLEHVGVAVSGGNTTFTITHLSIWACFSVNNPLTVSTASPLPTGTVGTAYTQTLAASGGTPPYSWTVTAGSVLPAGLTISSAGVISGTPTTAGTVSTNITVTDSTARSTTKAFSITVNPTGGALSITTASPLTAGTVAVAYGPVTLNATGGTAPYIWTVAAGSALPAGLALSTAGVITGTPTTAGTVSTNITVTDAVAGTVTKALSITINAAGTPLAITTTSPLLAATFGTAYSQSLAATGGTSPFTWALASGSAALPAGLTLSTAGIISGTPTAPAVPNAATSNFTVGVTDAVLGSITKPFAITASLSASSSSGRSTFDANCAGCHALGIYDVAGNPQLGGLGAATLTTALNARFAGGISHNGRTLTATLITDMLNFLSLY